ncbi:MBL fold metallo-hydrolase [Sphaerotilaceae bacterium SBD11-9]
MTLRRIALRIGAGLLVLLALGVAFVVVQFQRHPSLAPYRALTLPEAAPGDGVRVRFGGVSTLVFDDGETVWMTDGFFSRPGARQTFTGKIGPDAARIDAALKQLGVTRLAAVVPVHSHYDHAMDSPLVAQRTGARLIGSESSLLIGRGLGLTPEQMQLVKPGEVVTLGKFSLRFIASRHSPTPYSDGTTVENIEAPVVPPARATAYREGTVWSIAVTHASGASFLVQGSAGFVPGSLAGIHADTVFLGTGTLGKKDAAYRAAYWNETVKAVGAKRVIATHWDNFWLPLDQPLQAMPLLLDDFDAVMADLASRGAQDGVDIRLPPLFAPFKP